MYVCARATGLQGPPLPELLLPPELLPLPPELLPLLPELLLDPLPLPPLLDPLLPPELLPEELPVLDPPLPLLDEEQPELQAAAMRNAAKTTRERRRCILQRVISYARPASTPAAVSAAPAGAVAAV